MRNGDFSRYYSVSSPIHFLNPLCKVLTLFIFVFMSFLCSSIRVVCSLFIILIYIMIVSNVPFKKYFDYLFGFRFLFIFIFIINLFFTGFYGSIIIVSRVCLIVLYYFVLIFTTTTNELAYGFSQLLKPLSVFSFSIFNFSMRLSLILNFIPCLFLKSNKVFKSQVSRGYNNSFLHRLLGFKSSFILTFRNFRSLFNSLNVRDFDYYKSSVCDYRFRFLDVYMIFCHVMILVFVLIKEVVL